MNPEKTKERINYLKDKIYNDGKIVYVDDDMIPETFSQDMKCIFGCDPGMDIIVGASRSADDSPVDCTVAVIEKDMNREDVLVALADYVNGTGLQFILCAFPEEHAKKKEYELEPNDEYVEGPAELFVGDVFVMGESNLLIEGPLSLGLNSEGEPSDVAKAIAEGKHFVKELIDTDDTKLI